MFKGAMTKLPNRTKTNTQNNTKPCRTPRRNYTTRYRQFVELAVGWVVNQCVAENNTTKCGWH